MDLWNHYRLKGGGLEQEAYIFYPLNLRLTGGGDNMTSSHHNDPSWPHILHSQLATCQLPAGLQKGFPPIKKNGSPIRWKYDFLISHFNRTRRRAWKNGSSTQIRGVVSQSFWWALLMKSCKIRIPMVICLPKNRLNYMNDHKLFIPCHPQTRSFQVNVKLKILDQNAIQFKLLTYMRASANVAWGTG